MFTAYPTYSRYRTLFLTSPMLKGEDVYALQNALNDLGFDCGDFDGILGSKTSNAIRQAQKAFFLTVDGMAGGNTQKTLAMELADRVASVVHVPVSAFKGQLETESGYRLGNYSPQRSDGSYDAGVVQRNTKYTPPQDGFEVRESIQSLGELVRNHYLLFEGVSPERRRWALAQGAWNAPAYACYIAKQEGATKVTASMTARPGDEARRAFEEYVASASAYLVL